MIIPPPPAAYVQNWTGYEWRVTTVAATEFVVPSFPYKSMSAAERSNHTALAIWAGLGVSPYIEQIGIYDYVQNGQVGWAGFCAFWPSSNVSCGQGISTGDTMFLKVTRAGLTYTMTMRDAGPHNHWVVTVTKKLNHVDTTAEAMVEDTEYPGYSFTPLTYFAPFKMATSNTPATQVDSRWAIARRLTSRLIEIFHR